MDSYITTPEFLCLDEKNRALKILNLLHTTDDLLVKTVKIKEF